MKNAIKWLGIFAVMFIFAFMHSFAECEDFENENAKNGVFSYFSDDYISYPDGIESNTIKLSDHFIDFHQLSNELNIFGNGIDFEYITVYENKNLQSVFEKYANNNVETQKILFSDLSNQDMVKLPETITNSDGNYSRYEYDSNNRITKITMYENNNETSSTTLIYNDNNIIKWNEYTINKSGNEVNINSGVNPGDYFGRLTLNNDGYPIEITDGWIESEFYVSSIQYKSGNIVKMIYPSYDYDEPPLYCIFTYDEKKSPFINCATPAWWMIKNFSHGYGNNNVIEANYSDGDRFEYLYEYDSDGFPTKRTVKNSGYTTSYQYREQTANTDTHNTVQAIENTTIPTSNIEIITSGSTIKNEPAVLHIYRKRRPLDIFPKRYEILLDNVVVGNTTNNWKITVTVNTFGTKTLSAIIEGRKAEVRNNFQPGGVYYLRCDVDSKTTDTGRTKTTTNRNGIITTIKITDMQYTPILLFVDKSIGESEFNAIK